MRRQRARSHSKTREPWHSECAECGPGQLLASWHRCTCTCDSGCGLTGSYVQQHAAASSQPNGKSSNVMCSLFVCMGVVILSATCLCVRGAPLPRTQKRSQTLTISHIVSHSLCRDCDTGEYAHRRTIPTKGFDTAGGHRRSARYGPLAIARRA